MASELEQLTVIFFAGLRERAGTRSVQVHVSAGMTVGDAVVAARSAAPNDPAPVSTVMLALNGRYVESEHLVQTGDELALIPPVSGGSGELRSDRDWVFIGSDELDESLLIEFVTTGADGAVVTFLGVTRNNNEGRVVQYLSYEAYQPMAQNKIHEIIREMRDRWDLGKIAVAHRTGRVDIGQTSMVLAIGSPHRTPAIEAVTYFIDRLKEIVPIWKKEFFEGGEVWIGETPGHKNPSDTSNQT